jgi:integrase
MGVAVREKQKGSGIYWLFIRHAGERVSQLAGDKETAEDAAKDVRKDIRTGRFDIAAMKAARATERVAETTEVLTLRDYYEKTVQPLWEGSLSRNTHLSYDGSFRVHVLPALGDVALSDLSRDRVKRFVAELRKKPVSTPSNKQPEASDDAERHSRARSEQPRLLSKETIRNIVAALRAGLSEAVESNLIVANPAVKLGKFYKEASDFHEEFDPFTTDEVSTLLQVTREHFGYEHYVLLLTLFHCGLRAGEAAGLYWSDLDVKNKTLLVRRQFTRGRKGKPKTRKKRAVDVSTVLLAELQTLKKRRQTEYLANGKNEIPECIFLSPGQIIWEDGEPAGHAEGSYVDMDNWRNRVFWKACDKAKIRRRRVHDTRHTFASLLLSNGEPLKYVSTQLGHASIRMTADVYGHLEIGSNRAAMDRLPSLDAASFADVAAGAR